MMSLLKRHLLALLLVAHIALGVAYSVQIPAWEAYDEWGHYSFARFIATHWRLPQEGEKQSKDSDEYRQPPLYYALAGVASAWVRAPERFTPERNRALNEDITTGYNFAVHGVQEGWPYSGVSLAMHLMRWVSVLLSAVGVWATYKVVRLWKPDDEALALGAAALHAFWPQFLFSGSVVTNDVLASVAASLFVLALFNLRSSYSVVRIPPRASDSESEPPDTQLATSDTQHAIRNVRREAPIGYLALAAFLILLSKLNVYGLLPFGVVIALGLWLSHRSRRSRANRRPWWVVAGAVAAGIGLLALTLFVLLPLLNNIALVARINQFVHSLTNRRLWKAVPWEIWDETLLYGSKTFWASFGWGNLEAPAWTYTASAVAALIALFGLAAALARSGSRDRHLFAGVGLLLAGLLGAISVPYFFALFRRNLNLFPGRYLLSALTPVSILLALGIASWWRGRWRSVSLVGLAAGLFVLSASFPFTVIAPAYRPPALLEASVESAITHSLYNDFGIEILLVGYDVNDSNSRPGGEVALTLYWKALAPIDKNYTLNVIAVSPQGRNYATHRAYPGHGNFATTLWKPGDFFRDTYVLPIPADALGPAVGQFRVGFDLPDGQNAFPDAFLTANLFGEFKVAAPPPTGTGEGLSSPTPTSYRMGNVITLKGYTLAPSASSLDLTLFWHADQSRAGNWMVSLALLDSRGKIVAQGDGPPLSGAYPTRWWDAGEQIMDPHYLVLPTGLPCGNYQLVFGLYDSTTLARLPITGDGPLTVKDNLFWLDVSPAAPLCGP